MRNSFAILALLIVACTSCLLTAQGLEDVQIHGFATQGFLVSSHNNFLGMDTRHGSADWTEAALNVNDRVTDRLRVGIQFHYTRLGVFGGDTPTIDWALGDFRVNDALSLRGGKVKIRWGLFNDTQDYDPGYLWSMLPESTYGVDIRATNLSQNGIELRGRLPVGKKYGKLTYNACFGYYHYSSDDGYLESLHESGYTFVGTPFGKTPTVDVRWEAPIHGLTLGGSVMDYDAKGTMTNGTYKLPTTYWVAGYGQYSHGKYYAAGQYSRLVQYQTFNVTGEAPLTLASDNRAWFLMGAYHVTEKFQVGAYFDKVTNPPGVARQSRQII